MISKNIDKIDRYLTAAKYVKTRTWWRHQTETFSTTDGFPSQTPVTRSFDISLIYAWRNGWANNQNASELRHHRAHYDVTVMSRVCMPSVSTPVLTVVYHESQITSGLLGCYLFLLHEKLFEQPHRFSALLTLCKRTQYNAEISQWFTLCNI